MVFGSFHVANDFFLGGKRGLPRSSQKDSAQGSSSDCKNAQRKCPERAQLESDALPAARPIPWRNDACQTTLKKVSLDNNHSDGAESNAPRRSVTTTLHSIYVYIYTSSYIVLWDDLSAFSLGTQQRWARGQRNKLQLTTGTQRRL